MAFAIVHFLVGASLFLLLAAPLALRSERVRDSGLLLVTAGGIWGLIPDVHHLAPVFQDQLYALHGTPLVDLFAFHYMLDLDPVRDQPNLAIFVSLVLFSLSVAVFTATSRMGGRYEDRRVTVGTGTVSGILAAALVSTFILGTVFLSGGYLPSIGMLSGSTAILGWPLLVGATTVGAVGFSLLVELGPGADGLSPARAGVIGSVLGVVAWLFGVVMALPIFLLRFFGTDLSLAHIDVFTLVGFAVAGGALGWTYMVVARRVDDGSTRKKDQFSLQR
jgi:hypothetical protein